MAVSPRQYLTVPFLAGHEAEALASMRAALPLGWRWVPVTDWTPHANVRRTSDGLYVYSYYDIQRDEERYGVKGLMEQSAQNEQVT